MKRAYTILTFLLVILVAYTNCSSSEQATQSSSINQIRSTNCSAPPGVSASPQSIEQAVALMNSLPTPVTISCFIESLERPLNISATYSTASVQPAVGAESPRIFIFNGPLIMAVAPAGSGKNSIEFGLVKNNGQSLKAETLFPLYSTLSPAEPYKRIQNGSGTTCTGCHSNEFRDYEIKSTQAFISKALRPFANFKVTSSSLKNERVICANLKNDRCDMLRAIYDHGTVIDVDFPSSVP